MTPEELATGLCVVEGIDATDRENFESALFDVDYLLAALEGHAVIDGQPMSFSWHRSVRGIEAFISNDALKTAGVSR